MYSFSGRIIIIKICLICSLPCNATDKLELAAAAVVDLNPAASLGLVRARTGCTLIHEPRPKKSAFQLHILELVYIMS